MALLTAAVPVNVSASQTSLHLQLEKDEGTSGEKASSVIRAPGSSVKTVSGTKKTAVVKTGDASAAALMTAVGLTAGAGICILLYCKRKRYHKEK